MQSHPCRECPRLDQDKNNPTCRRCNKRLQYVDELERRLNFSRCAETQPFTVSGSLLLSRMSLGTNARVFIN